MDEARNDQNDLIIGRNAVFEAVKSGREIDRLFVQRGEQNPAVKRLISMAREKGAVIKEVDSKKLDFMCGGHGEQTDADGRGQNVENGLPPGKMLLFHIGCLL